MRIKNQIQVTFVYKILTCHGLIPLPPVAGSISVCSLNLVDRGQTAFAFSGGPFVKPPCPTRPTDNDATCGLFIATAFGLLCAPVSRHRCSPARRPSPASPDQLLQSCRWKLSSTALTVCIDRVYGHNAQRWHALCRVCIR
jgi:hypothetical protein